MDSEPDPEPDSIILKPISHEDQPILKRLLKNPKIAKSFIKGSEYLDQEIDVIFSQLLSFWEKFNFGMYSVHLDNQPAGIAGFKYCNDTQQVELLYFIDEPFWGKGWASQIAQTLTEKAFKEIKLESLVSYVDPENVASHKILKKIGMQEFSRWEKNGHEFLLLKALNPEPSTPKNCLFEEIYL